MLRSIGSACLGSVILLGLPVAAANAQTTNNAAVDWSGSYGFKSNADRNLRLLQADIIRKGEGDYYDSISKAPQYNVTNNSSSSTEIGQQTTTIGSVNTATNNIDVKDAVDIGLNLSNTSSNHGCLNGSVSIDSRPRDVGASTCN
ncbi:hypothetical protein [Aureimonas sp. SK2]|uniref:hypothetical protein n=1 Tax=Aureimonas sp. SK2 TaxID=3015992 RepID=UPI0024453823|nr:hypothetical protein [Aureimonas sp. SK2]